MKHAEIFSKLSPRTASQDIGFKITGDGPTVGWEDVLLALQGIPAGRFSFLMYAYADDDQARHGFFAELFMDVMQDLAIHRWILDRKNTGGYHREVELLCQLAVQEWKGGDYQRGTQIERADFMGVSRATWKRRYHLVYGTILTRPNIWEDEIMKIVADRLT